MECPMEDKHIVRLLFAKVHGKPLPKDATITVHECDVYGEKNPWEIWEAFGGRSDNNNDNNNGSRVLYIFSTINMMKPSRTIGLGSWEPQCKDVTIAHRGTCQRVAVKKYLRFDKSGTNHDGAWTMHEYSLDPSSLLRTPSANYSYVLCKLIKNQGNPIRLTSREGITSQEVTNNIPRTRVSTSAAASFIATQLIESNKGAVKGEEEDIELVPNPFARDLLLERLDINYFGNSNWCY